MNKGHIIDFLIVSWIVASVVLLLVFARYTLRCWKTAGWREVYSKMTFFNGLVFHHVGNVILLMWFWYMIHSGIISLRMRDTDTKIVVVGLVLAVFGVLYKVRIFTSSALEVYVTTGITLVLSALSIVAMYFN